MRRDIRDVDALPRIEPNKSGRKTVQVVNSHACEGDTYTFEGGLQTDGLSIRVLQNLNRERASRQVLTGASCQQVERLALESR